MQIRYHLFSWTQSKATRQGIQLAIFRFGSLFISALAQIYAARQLGPEKLGISGMALIAVAQGNILVSFGADPLLVRRCRESDSEDARRVLMETAFGARLLLVLILGLGLTAFIPLLRQHPDFVLSAVCVLPLIFFLSNQALWVLQAKESLPAQYFSNVVSAVIGAGLIFLFINPLSPAGSDVVVMTIAASFAFFLSWRFASGGMPRVRLDFRAILSLLRASGWLFGSAALIYVYTQIEQPLLGAFCSVSELGLYRSALQVVGAVSSFVAMVPLLLYPKLITWKSASIDELWFHQKRLFRKFIPWIILLSLIAFAALPFLYPRIFGARFEAAAIPCALLVTSKFVTILNGIFGWGLWALGRDRLMLIIMLGVAMASLGLNVFSIPRFGMVGAAGVNLLSELLILVACAWQMRRIMVYSRAIAAV